ncbi:MAG TPA: hypothetical protein VF735_03985 [Pyrinomonadaceae bacterium]
MKGSSPNQSPASERATGHPQQFFPNPDEGEKTMIEETNIELEVEEMEQMDAPGIMLGD